MNLNKQLKETFINKLERKIYTKRIEAARLKVAGMGNLLYKSIFSDEVALRLEALPKAVMPRRDHISSKHGYDCSIDLELSIPMPWPSFGNTHTLRHSGIIDLREGIDGFAYIKYQGLEDLIRHPDKFNKVYLEIKDLYEKYIEEIDSSEKFIIEMTQALSGVRTVKALKNLSEDIGKEWDELMQNEDNKSLPCIIPNHAIEAIKASRAEAA